MFLSRRFQRFPMRSDQLWQAIRPFASRAHVIVVEGLDLADLGQTPFPFLHPRMRTRRTRPWSKKNQTPAHGLSLERFITPDHVHVEILPLKEAAEERRCLIRDGDDLVRCLTIEFEIELRLR